MNRQVDAVIISLNDECPECLSIFFKLLIFLVKLFLYSFEIFNFFNNISINELLQNALLFLFIRIRFENLELFFHLLIVHKEQWNIHSFNEVGVHAILSVNKLNNLVTSRPHSLVVLDLNILESLDESPLNISGLCCLARCVDDAFTTAHGVEVELLGSQPSEETV